MATEDTPLNPNEIDTALPYSAYSSLTNRFVEAIRVSSGLPKETMEQIVKDLGINNSQENGAFAGTQAYFIGLNGKENIPASHTTAFVVMHIFPPFQKTFSISDENYPFSRRELIDCFCPNTRFNSKERVYHFIKDLDGMGEDKADLFKTYYSLIMLAGFYRKKIVEDFKEKVEDFEGGRSGIPAKTKEEVETYLRKIFLDGTESRNGLGIKYIPLQVALGRYESMTKLITNLSLRFEEEVRGPLYSAMHAYTYLRDSGDNRLNATRKTLVQLMKEGKYTEAANIGNDYNEQINKERGGQK